MTMLLKHHFFHADCHAGNMLLRLPSQLQPAPHTVSTVGSQRSRPGHEQCSGDCCDDSSASGSQDVSEDSQLTWWERLRKLWQSGGRAAHSQPKLVLLDAGLASELPVATQRNLSALLKDVLFADGEHAARMFLRLSEVSSSNPEGFIQDMAKLFRLRCGSPFRMVPGVGFGLLQRDAQPSSDDDDKPVFSDDGNDNLEALRNSLTVDQWKQAEDAAATRPLVNVGLLIREVRYTPPQRWWMHRHSSLSAFLPYLRPPSSTVIRSLPTVPRIRGLRRGRSCWTEVATHETSYGIPTHLRCPGFCLAFVCR